jgi:Cof subfamily protein (haloacid dehalogenase superfamily)
MLVRRRFMKLAATDLDRTLLDNAGNLSDRNLKALNKLKSKGFVTVIATGRNLYSARKVLEPDLPLDYLVFSSGCGVLDWDKDRIIYNRTLSEESVDRAVKILMKHKADFMIHKEIPHNHHFVFFQNGFYNADFQQRIKIYRDFTSEWNGEKINFNVSQILAVIPEKEMAKFNEIRHELEFVKVIRTTSPLDHETRWLEIFPPDVSKGHTLAWLSKELNIPAENTYSLGNDYNDIDMLEWTEVSYLVANAFEDLKLIFPHTLSNEENGFSVWAENIIKKGN